MGTRLSESGPATRDAGKLYIELLGGFRLSANGVNLRSESWRSRRAALVVKLLALAPEHSVHRERLFDVLWPEADPAAAANNLRQTLHVARQQLGELQLDPADLLHLNGERVQLYQSNGVSTDVEAFEAFARGARGSTDPAAYWEAIDRYRGPLLPDDPYEDWIVTRREMLASLHDVLLEEVSQLHEQRAEYSRAIAALRLLTAAEPAHEAAQVRLMRLYSMSGNRAFAIRQYRVLERSLGQYLDVAPEPETRALYQAIVDRQFPKRSADESRSTRRDSARPADLATTAQHPQSLLSFIGREQELTDIAHAIETHRLVTLTGAPGSGKTRLALEVCRHVEESFQDGIWFVELAGVHDPALIVNTIAAALAVQEESERSLYDLLTDYLQHRRLLLLLDNCEHLGKACGAVVHRLLSGCPTITIVATSRARLNIAGEFLWHVLPFPVPDPNQIDDLEKLERTPSVRLFIERSRLHRPYFRITEQTAAAVVEICRGLGGLPLAIELAAARTNVLSPAQIAERLTDSLELLVTHQIEISERQRALRATLEWSERLLAPEEANLFHRLAVFQSEFTLDAAEHVGPTEPDDSGLILDRMASLVDQSLVLVRDDPEASRFHLLEPVRQFAWERLNDRGLLDVARDRHALYYVNLASRAASALIGVEQAHWLDRLERERDNIRVAMDWLERTNVVEGLRLVGSLWRFWYLRGHYSEGIASLRKFIDAAGESVPALRATALLGLGAVSFRAGRLKEARNVLEESIVVHRAVGDPGGTAWSLAYLGHVAGALGDEETAARCPEEALPLFRQVDDLAGLARVLNAMGEIKRSSGDDEQAAVFYEEALECSRASGHRAGDGMLLHNLGYVHLHRGNLSDAVACFLESTHIHEELGDVSGLAMCTEALAASAAVAGKAEDAALLFGAAEAQRQAAIIRIDVADQAEHDRFISEARSSLTDKEFEAAWSAGYRLGRDAAIERARSILLNLETPRLTGREMQIAKLVGRNLTNAQIAAELGLSERTVATHVSHILRKLGVPSRHEIINHLGNPNSGSPPS